MHLKLANTDMHRHKNPGAGKNTALLAAGLTFNTHSYKPKASSGFSVILTKFNIVIQRDKRDKR